MSTEYKNAEQNCFINDYEFYSVITSPYNDILWKLGNFDFHAPPRETKWLTRIGEYASFKYDAEKNIVYVLIALSNRPTTTDYKKVFAYIERFNENFLESQKAGWPVIYKPPKNGLSAMRLQSGYKIKPKFIVPVAFMEGELDTDLIYYNIDFSVVLLNQSNIYGTANKSIYNFRYEDCIGIRLQRFPTAGLKVTNVIEKHRNRDVDAEGSYNDFYNCAYEYDSRGFNGQKYNDVLNKSDRFHKKIVDKYDKIIFIANYFALDKKGRRWEQDIDLERNVFFGYNIDFQTFGDYDSLFSIKKDIYYLGKYHEPQ